MERGAAPGARRGEGVDRPRSRKARAAAAAREAHEHRLGDVVLLVPEPENPDAARGHLPAEELEARRAGLRLAAAPAPGLQRPRTSATPSAAHSLAQKRASASGRRPAGGG